jgi:hypothetical protein
VIDPWSGLDAVRDVAVVAPGFINLHSHAWTPLGQRFELQDGITFGASLGHAWVRSAILEGGQRAAGMDDLLGRMLRGEGGSFDTERRCSSTSAAASPAIRPACSRPCASPRKPARRVRAVCASAWRLFPATPAPRRFRRPCSTATGAESSAWITAMSNGWRQANG